MLRYTHKTEQNKVGRIRCYNVLSFSNGCALILQPEALENICRMKKYYLNIKQDPIDLDWIDL